MLGPPWAGRVVPSLGLVESKLGLRRTKSSRAHIGLSQVGSTSGRVESNLSWVKSSHTHVKLSVVESTLSGVESLSHRSESSQATSSWIKWGQRQA